MGTATGALDALGGESVTSGLAQKRQRHRHIPRFHAPLFGIGHKLTIELTANVAERGPLVPGIGALGIPMAERIG